MVRNFLLPVLVLASTSAARAELTYAEFDNNRHLEAARSYVTGIAHGIFWSATGAKLKFGVNLYCPPAKVAITGDQYLVILDAYMENHRSLANKSVAFVMLLALADAFPC